MTYEEEVREYNAGMEDDDEGIQAWSTVNLDKREEEEEEVGGSNLTISNLQFYMLMQSCGLWAWMLVHFLARVCIHSGLGD